MGVIERRNSLIILRFKLQGYLDSNRNLQTSKAPLERQAQGIRHHAAYS